MLDESHALKSIMIHLIGCQRFCLLWNCPESDRSDFVIAVAVTPSSSWVRTICTICFLCCISSSWCRQPCTGGMSKQKLCFHRNFDCTLREASGCSGPNRLQWKAARSSSGRIWFPAGGKWYFDWDCINKDVKVELSISLMQAQRWHVFSMCCSSPNRAAKHGRCCVLSPSCLAASDSRYWCVVRFLPFQLSLSACEEK